MAARTLAIDARPGSVQWRADETALIVVDMQNGFLKPGGYFDNVGYDLSHSPRTVSQVVAAITAARQASVQVIFIQSGFDAMHLCVGGDTAPVWHKSEAQVLMRERPALARRLITEGTWDYELVDEMAPAADEPVIRKSRYSAFAGTSLDQLLRARRTRNLVFCGVAANVCVETSLRDAYGHEYFVLLLEDATHHAGPDFVRQATLWNVERFFGWVASVAAWQDAAGAER